MKLYLPTILALLCITACTNEPLTPEAYLNQHKQEINIEDFEDNADLNSILSEEADIVVFLGGETHQVDCNSKIQFKLLKYLHQTAGVRYFLMELPHSYAWFYNTEISKDTLRESFNNLAFFKNLYEFNSTLPQDERIVFIGIDIERIHQQTIYVLHQIIAKNDSIPEEISPQLDNISSIYNALMQDMVLSDSINQNLRTLAYQLADDLEKNKESYQLYLKEDFLSFDVIVNSLVNNYEAKWGESKELDNQQEVGGRERSMFSTFLKFYPTLQGNVFGQFGSMHVRQDTTGIERLDDEISTWTNPQTFAYNLNVHSESPVRGKVISIGYNYLNCFTAQQNREYTEQGVPTQSILDKKTEDEMVQASTSNYTLFKLTGLGSPYRELMTDFQYILLIQNQKGQKQ